MVPFQTVSNSRKIVLAYVITHHKHISRYSWRSSMGCSVSLENRLTLDKCAAQVAAQEWQSSRCVMGCFKQQDCEESLGMLCSSAGSFGAISGRLHLRFKRACMAWQTNLGRLFSSSILLWRLTHWRSWPNCLRAMSMPRAFVRWSN